MTSAIQIKKPGCCRNKGLPQSFCGASGQNKPLTSATSNKSAMQGVIILRQDSSKLPPSPLLCYDLQRSRAHTNNRSRLSNKFVDPVPVLQC